MLYLFYGDDEFKRDQAIRQLLNGQQATRIVHEGDDDLLNLVKALKQSTLYGKQWLWCQKAMFLRIEKGKGKTKTAKAKQPKGTTSTLTATEVLTQTLTQLQPSKHLIISCDYKPNQTLKLTKLVLEGAKWQEFWLTPRWQTDVLQQETAADAKAMGLRLTPQALQVLVNAIGNQTRPRHQELLKLQLLNAEGTPLDEATVRAVVTDSAASSLQLADALRLRETQHAVDLIHQLLAQNEHPLVILQTLVTQCRTWLWVKALQKEQATDQAIATAVGIGNPNRVYYLKQAVAGSSIQQLCNNLQALLEADRALKQGDDSCLTLKRLVLAINRYQTI